jgi:hypothetical protein
MGFPFDGSIFSRKIVSFFLFVPVAQHRLPILLLGWRAFGEQFAFQCEGSLVCQVVFLAQGG